jgi:hypothetical protein
MHPSIGSTQSVACRQPYCALCQAAAFAASEADAVNSCVHVQQHALTTAHHSNHCQKHHQHSCHTAPTAVDMVTGTAGAGASWSCCQRCWHCAFWRHCCCCSGCSQALGPLRCCGFRAAGCACCWCAAVDRCGVVACKHNEPKKHANGCMCIQCTCYECTQSFAAAPTRNTLQLTVTCSRPIQHHSYCSCAGCKCSTLGGCIIHLCSCAAPQPPSTYSILSCCGCRCVLSLPRSPQESPAQ